MVERINYMFIDYLKEHGVLDNSNYTSFKHFLDMDLKDFLIESKLFDESKIKFLWGEYRRNGNNKRPQD